MHIFLSEPEFHCYLVYTFRRVAGNTDVSEQLKKLVTRYKKKKNISYNTNILRHTAYMVVNPFIVDNYVSLSNCKTVSHASDYIVATAARLPNLCHVYFLCCEALFLF